MYRKFYFCIVIENFSWTERIHFRVTLLNFSTRFLLTGREPRVSLVVSHRFERIRTVRTVEYPEGPTTGTHSYT